MDNIDRINKTAASAVSTNASPARMPRTIKKVDLGAAANYGREQSNVSDEISYKKNYCTFYNINEIYRMVYLDPKIILCLSNKKVKMIF